MLKSAEKFLRLYLSKHAAGNRRTAIEINNYSFNIVNSFLRLQSFVPLSSWTISPTAILHILNYIALYKPKIIVEFGMGLSTLYISKLIEQNKLDSQLFSIDHDKYWIEHVQSWLKTEQQSYNVHLLHTPLKENFSFKSHRIQWYDTAVLDKHITKEQVELLVIDAPPKAFLYSRAGALLYFAEQLQSGQLNYFFDDANRKEEKEILNSLGVDTMYFLDYALGGKREQKFNTIPISLYK